jgi:hypothetical protein
MSLPEDGTAILQNCAKAGDPPMIQYHDGTGTLLEIFIPSGTYKQAMSLIEEQDWEALSQFPRWSDQPALESGQPNVMRYNDPRTGKDREIYLPLGTLKTASQLLMAEDWEGLGKNFMVYSKSRYCSDTTVVME